MKGIAIISELPTQSGGSENFAARLTRGLIAEGVSATIYATGPVGGQFRDLPVEIYARSDSRADWRKYVFHSFALAWALWKHRTEFTLIHVHIARRNAFVSAIMGKLLRKPVIVSVVGGGHVGEVFTMSGGIKTGYERWRSRLLWQGILTADRFIAKSRQIYEELLTQGVPPERIIHIPNGVPLVEEIERRPNPLQPIRAISVARLDQGKRVDVLIQAAALVDNIHVTLVGDGPERHNLEALVRTLGIANRIRFAGDVPDAALHCLPEADIFAFTSSSEGHPNALLEAMGRGLPCITTLVGGIRDVVIPEQTAIVVPVGDAAALAAAIRRVAADATLRAKIGTLARQQIIEHYTVAHAVANHLALYRSLC